jgi:hypothetical protein
VAACFDLAWIVFSVVEFLAVHRYICLDDKSRRTPRILHIIPNESIGIMESAPVVVFIGMLFFLAHLSVAVVERARMAHVLYLILFSARSISDRKDEVHEEV